MKTPLEKIIDRALQSVVDDISFVHDTRKTGSPIEAILLAAIFSAVRYHGPDSAHDLNEVFITEPGKPAYLPDMDRLDHCISIQCQAPVLSYRADFLIHAQDSSTMKWTSLVVECDGHEFHERTKDQAAHDRSRDRAMQEAGFTVFRFTGSEIYRDPCGCADQVLAWAHKATFR